MKFTRETARSVREGKKERRGMFARIYAANILDGAKELAATAERKKKQAHLHVFVCRVRERIVRNNIRFFFLFF